MSKEFIAKIILIGDYGVGKTNLRRKLLGVQFQDIYNKTIGVEISHLDISKEDTHFTLSIWDLAGDIDFLRIRSSYFSNSNAIIFVFDTTKEINEETTKLWIKDIEENIGQKTALALIINKIDLENRVLTPESLSGIKQELMEFEMISDVLIFETSAKTGERVSSVLDWIVSTLLIDVRQEMILKEECTNPSNYAYAFYLMKPFGPELFSHNLGDRSDLDLEDSLTHLGISYISALGHGHTYVEGCYELPPGNFDDYNTIVFSIKINNSPSDDARYEELYSVYTLFIKKEIYERIQLSSRLRKKLFTSFQKLQDVTEITERYGKDLMRKMISIIGGC